MTNRKITVLGSGAMATACSLLLAENTDHEIYMWARSEDLAAIVEQTRVNHRLAPATPLPANVHVTGEMASAINQTSLLVAAIPTQFLRAVALQHAKHIGPDVPIVSVIKGLELGTFLRPTQILQDVLHTNRIAVLSGPSHAEEIAQKMPAIVVAASKDELLAHDCQQAFTTESFRVYTNSDVVGVELAGALKNVIAIAAGICDGLGFGANAKSALLTRGLVEMIRFGSHFGAKPETFMGLAGMGDLVTTCFSPYGRNRFVGEELGQGKTLHEIMASMKAVAEGVATTRSVMQLAKREQIELPITHEVYRILYEGKPAREATTSLMLRPAKAE
jgi:glycerol-3-phosphate dehydrogenase (NAD(P)+)